MASAGRDVIELAHPPKGAQPQSVALVAARSSPAFLRAMWSSGKTPSLGELLGIFAKRFLEGDAGSTPAIAVLIVYVLAPRSLAFFFLRRRHAGGERRLCLFVSIPPIHAIAPILLGPAFARAPPPRASFALAFHPQPVMRESRTLASLAPPGRRAACILHSRQADGCRRRGLPAARRHRLASRYQLQGHCAARSLSACPCRVT